MKMFYDLFPVVLFFIAYKIYGMQIATGVLMAACAVQVLGYWLWKKKVEKVHWITLVAVLALGAPTVLLNNPVFIQWKPTVVNWILALVFLGFQVIGKKTLVERMMGANMELPRPVWNKLNVAWIVFFIFCGIVNIVVFSTCSENAWVNFKLFGFLGLNIVFIVGMMFFLKPYIKFDEEKPAAEPAE